MGVAKGARPSVCYLVAGHNLLSTAGPTRNVLSLARALSAELVVVHARGLLESAAAASEPPAWMVSLTELVDPEVAVRLAVDDGAAADVVLRVAEREGAGLVVVGRRGSGSPFELTLGSTSREVASRSPVPVVVVPH